MADLVLRALTRPSIEPREERVTRNRHHLSERLARQREQLLVALVEAAGIAAAAEKRAQQHLPLRRAMRPLGGHPRRRQQRAPLDARHDEAAAVHRMIDLLSSISKRNRRG